MKSYYIRQGDKRQGPYSIEQLRQMNINPAVQVWTQGLSKWIQAGEVPRLQQALFSTSAASDGGQDYTHPSFAQSRISIRKNWKTFLAVSLLCVAAYLIFSLQEPRIEPNVTETVVEPGVATTLVKEDRRDNQSPNPVSLIQGKLTWRKNLIGETVLEGSLHNAAKTDFKHIVFQLSWYSKSNTLIKTSRVPLEEYLAAGHSIEYKLKIKSPGKFGDLKYKIVSATAAN